jgi:hypothetical protein
MRAIKARLISITSVGRVAIAVAGRRISANKASSPIRLPGSHVARFASPRPLRARG